MPSIGRHTATPRESRCSSRAASFRCCTKSGFGSGGRSSAECGVRSAEFEVQGRSHREVSHETCFVGSDRKSTRLNSSHSQISYAVFCLKKKNHRIHSLLLIRSRQLALGGAGARWLAAPYWCG